MANLPTTVDCAGTLTFCPSPVPSTPDFPDPPSKPLPFFSQAEDNNIFRA